MDKHHHVADHDEDGNLLDRCAECGKDIRDEVHIRSDARPTPPESGGEDD